MAGATARNVDFSNVKDGGNFNRRRIPAGDYLATVTKVEDAQAKDGTPQYLVSIKINSHPSSVLPYYCKLQENQLWKLRNLLIAAGLTVPKKRVKVDPNKAVGKVIGVTIEDADYDGKEQSEVAGVFPAAELADGAPVTDDDDDIAEDDEDDADLTADDEDEDEEEAADPLADLDRAALKAELKKFDKNFQAKKSQSDDDLRDLLRAAQAEAAGDDEEEEAEEEEPAPKPAAKKAKKGTAKKKAAEVTDDELEELDIDDI